MQLACGYTLTIVSLFAVSLSEPALTWECCFTLLAIGDVFTLCALRGLVLWKRR